MDRRTPSQRRESFEQINASWAIEGQHMDVRDRYYQERIINGEMTHEEVIAHIKAEHEVGDGRSGD